jgi:pre-rRNA-processing protein TSR1
MAYGFPGVSVGYFSTPGKFLLKNPPKIWKNEIEKLYKQLSVFAEIKYHDLKDRNFARHLMENGKPTKWQQQRSYFVTQNVMINEEEEVSDSKNCKIVVQAVLNGCPLNVNSLVHICGVGVGRIAKITKMDGKTDNRMNEGVEEEEDHHSQEIVVADSEKQDDLILEAEGDILQGEQTWPEESEMEALEGEVDVEVEEEYIAAGLEGEEEGLGGDVMDFFNREQVQGTKQKQQQDKKNNNEDDQGDEMDEQEEDDEDEEERGDFVDTPMDQSARARFARYRALQSFRSSPWHPKENLPTHYSKIFQFEDMKGMQKRCCNLAEDLMKKQCEAYAAPKMKGNTRSRATSSSLHDGAMEMELIENNNNNEDSHSVAGGKSQKGSIRSSLADEFLLEGSSEYVRSNQFVSIEIDSVNKEQFMNHYQKNGYLVIFGLYSSEYKLSVLHFNIKRIPAFDGSANDISIRSKDPLLFVHGFRSFWTKPVFSESNLNCDKHKFQRYLPVSRFLSLSFIFCIFTLISFRSWYIYIGRWIFSR